jgi:hypothetical protein
MTDQEQLCACWPGQWCLGHYAQLPLRERRIVRRELGIRIPTALLLAEDEAERIPRRGPQPKGTIMSMNEAQRLGQRVGQIVGDAQSVLRARAYGRRDAAADDDFDGRAWLDERKPLTGEALRRALAAPAPPMAPPGSPRGNWCRCAECRRSR